jgi:hypothetical protein
MPVVKTLGKEHCKEANEKALDDSHCVILSTLISV